MFRRLHMAYVESSIAISRSVSPQFPLYIYPQSFAYHFANVQISSGSTKDSHSGVDGGAWDEPMQDM